MATTTSVLPSLDIVLAGEWNEWDCLTHAGPVRVNIEFDFEPGQREILAADPNDSQPGFPPEVNIYRVTLADDVPLTGEISEAKLKAGAKLWDGLAMPMRVERISPSEVRRLEDEILASVRKREFA